MPIYEYACGECEHVLDALQKLSDDPLVDCPACGKPALRKLLSAPKFRLKGSGWYETDFKSSNQRNILKSDSETASSSKSDSGDTKKAGEKSDSKPVTAKSDSKPAAKADSKPATKADKS